jgi:hypothetical protein
MSNRPCYPSPIPGYAYNYRGELIPIAAVGYGYEPNQWDTYNLSGRPGEVPGYFYNISDRLEPTRKTVTFGGFSAGQLASTGIISYAIVRLLGASVPGAIAMGIGNILWEAGSPAIPAGWKRYVLGLFRKPDSA